MSEVPGQRRAVAFHPPFIAVFPVLAVYSANVGLFAAGDLWRPLGVAVGGALAAWLILALARWSLEKGALVASTLIVGIWLYKPLVGERELSNIAIGCILLATGAAGWVASTRSRLPTRMLNAFSLLLVVIASASILLAARRGQSNDSIAGAAKGSAGHRPDIFVLLLDGYGRSDQIERVMKFDNGPFVKALSERGFFVAEGSHSNYCQTALSLASLLNLDFVQNLLPEADRQARDRDRLNELVDRPQIVRSLRAAGYESIAVGTGFPSFTFGGFDLVVETPQEITYFESTLLDMTPFGAPPGIAESMYVQRRRTLQEGFATLRRLAKKTARPRFVFAHILAPHPPFVFGSDGEEPSRRGTYGFWDGSDYMAHVGDAATYRSGYVGQIQWTNRQVLETVDALLSQPGPRPWILLLGDHGSKLGLDQNDIAKTDLRECFATLGAYHIPEIEDKLYAAITPVNAMRIVAAEITGSALQRVPDSSLWSPFVRPLDLTDVSDRVR